MDGFRAIGKTSRFPSPQRTTSVASSHWQLVGQLASGATIPSADAITTEMRIKQTAIALDTSDLLNLSVTKI